MEYRVYLAACDYKVVDIRNLYEKTILDRDAVLGHPTTISVTNQLNCDIMEEYKRQYIYVGNVKSSFTLILYKKERDNVYRDLTVPRYIRVVKEVLSNRTIFRFPVTTNMIITSKYPIKRIKIIAINVSNTPSIYKQMVDVKDPVEYIDSITLELMNIEKAINDSSLRDM